MTFDSSMVYYRRYQRKSCPKKDKISNDIGSRNPVFQIPFEAVATTLERADASNCAYMVQIYTGRERTQLIVLLGGDV